VNAKANNTIDKVQKLQRKLYLSAKARKKRRFHILYDKVYRKDILMKAWKQVKPTSKAMNNMRKKIKEVFSHRACLSNDIKDMVKTINKKLNGWKNYYALNYIAKGQLKKIDWYVSLRFTIWYRNKKQLKRRCQYTKELMRKLKSLKIVHMYY